MHNYPLSCRDCKNLKEPRFTYYNKEKECEMPSNLREGCPCHKCIEKNCPKTDARQNYPCKKFRETQKLFTPIYPFSSTPVYDDIH